VRSGVAILAVTLAACGAGSGDGLDQNGRPPSGSPTALVPTLDSIQANVFTPTCAVSGCHGGAGAQQGLQLDPGVSASKLINVPSPRDPNLIRVKPGDPDNSFIIQKLEGKRFDGLPILGAQMPDGGTPLQQSTIDVIRQWIANGAPQ